MTRINVVPVEELCDKHLLAEHRELTRIPNNIIKGKYSMEGQPTEYTLGAGHVKFFYDKLTYLLRRYALLHTECLKRGFNVKSIWPTIEFTNTSADPVKHAEMWKDYIPTEHALKINRERIAERTPKNAKFTKYREERNE